eukprot:1154860-Pelagomonas_calceolata.AAC.8
MQGIEKDRKTYKIESNSQSNMVVVREKTEDGTVRTVHTTTSQMQARSIRRAEAQNGLAASRTA